MNHPQEKSRKQQFQDELKNMEIAISKSTIRVEDAQNLLNAGDRLLLQYERVYNSRAEWRIRAETAEAKLKNNE